MNINTDFYDKVLSDYSDHSLFVAVDIKSREYTGRVVIKNADLYYFFNQTKGYDKEKYKAFMKKLLLNKTRLSIETASLSKWGFVNVTGVNGVKKYSSKSLQEFINHYFQGKVIKDNVGDDERNAIINKLFEWKIATRIDDETGYLVIVR